MLEELFITLAVLFGVSTLLSMVGNIGNCRTPMSNVTGALAICGLLFSIIALNLVQFDIEVGRRYQERNSNPFRHIDTYEVIAIADGYVQYIHIMEDSHTFTNSSSIREFRNDVVK